MPSFHQLRLAFHAQKKAQNRKNLIAGHASQVLTASRGLNISNQVVDDAIDGFLEVFPQKKATKTMAGIHEAAHFVAYTVLGLGAWKAEIHGTKFGRGGWGGRAVPCNDFDPQNASGKHFLNEALATLAGPFAEHILGNGDAYSSVGELFAARIYVSRAALHTGQNSDTLWYQTLVQAEGLVHQYREHILVLASFLETRKEITCIMPSVKKILKTINPSPPLSFSILSCHHVLADKFRKIISNLLG